MKYALLHCSYSAPVVVSDITSDMPSIAARETMDDAVLAVVLGVAARVVVAARETDFFVLRLFVVTVWFGVAARVVALRETAVSVARDVTELPDVLDTTGVVVRGFVVRVTPFCAVAVRDNTFDDCDVVDVVPSRLVAFSSRTAALAVPMQIVKIPRKCRISFISIKY